MCVCVYVCLSMRVCVRGDSMCVCTCVLEMACIELILSYG